MFNETMFPLTDIMFFAIDNGFEVFNKYYIEVKDDQYNVRLINGFNVYTFCKIQNAVTWCTYDYRNKILDCNKILELDNKLNSINFTIILREKLLNKTSAINNRELYAIKLNEDRLQKAKILKLLNGYINSAVDWQVKKFNSKIPTFRAKR